MAETPAARLGDPSDHGGTIISASSTTFVDGIATARTGDLHSCPIHGVTPLIGTAKTLVDGKIRVRVGDRAECGAVIISGSPTVMVG